MTSYANELPTCMFMASELQSDGRLKSWKEYTPEEIKERGVLVGKQDIRQLKVHIIKYWVDHIEAVLAKHNLKPEEIDYVIPMSLQCSFTRNLMMSFLIGELL